jgi:3-oxoacyl-[acyl-carrier-protein] synthase III
VNDAHRPRPRVGATAVIEGLGTWVPPRVVTNHDLAEQLDTSDEWVRTRTGIVERRFADPGTTTVDLATEAGARAIKSAGDAPCDAVIVATTTPDRLCPGTAPEVASRLGLPHVAAHDVQAVCSGFVYGLASATGHIAAGIAGRVLLIGAEVITPFMNPEDRGTVVIFGDGAGAVVVRAGEPDEPGAIGPFDLGSDGEHSVLISVAAGGSRIPTGRDQPDREQHYFYMDGREVYRHAIPRMVASSQAVLERAGLTVDAVDRFVGHQANARILDAVGDRLGIPPDRRVINLDRYGNTAAATIPLALADAGLSVGDRVLITAFGGGLTWGSTTFTWPELVSA